MRTACMARWIIYSMHGRIHFPSQLINIPSLIVEGTGQEITTNPLPDSLAPMVEYFRSNTVGQIEVHGT